MNFNARLVAILLLSSAGLFGAANWFCYLKPMMPMIRADVSDDHRKAVLAEYHHSRDTEAAQAMVPFPVAVTLTAIGLVGCFVVLVGNHPNFTRRYDSSGTN